MMFIIFSMTYEEYRSSKDGSKKKSIVKSMLGKLFTIVIFVLIVMIISNISPKFRNYVNDNVLNSTIDFSFVNKFTNKVTDLFKNKDYIPVVKTDDEYEKYLDGVKYVHSGDVSLKSSGIVTFIGEKEGYGNTIVVQQSNGYYAWYGNVKESVKIYDYVEKNSSIGTCENEYYYVLLKDDKPVDLLNES